MFGVNVSEIVLVLAVLLAVLGVLYAVVRMGSHHGLLDAERRRGSRADEGSAARAVLPPG